MDLPRRTALAPIAALIGALAWPGAAAGQLVSGTVSARATGAPLLGVVVEVTDSAARRVASALSGDRGVFRLRVPGPGSYRFQVRRIGFRPTRIGPVRIDGDTTVALRMDEVPLQLPTVTASERTLCSTGRAEASATAVLIESAATALEATTLTLEQGGYTFDVVNHRREYTLGPTLLRDVSLGTQRVRDVRPWTSLGADALARHGFVHLQDNMLHFVAPDLAVLTSAPFAASHCFRVAEEPERPGEIGLRFDPVRDLERSDIRGTLWLDAASLELRELDFTFTELQFFGRDTLAGGRLLFARLPNGGWVPNDWIIRSPVPPGSFVSAVARRGAREGVSVGPVAITPRDPQWSTARVSTTGASILAVRQTDAPDSAALWRSATGALEVLVRFRRGEERGPAPGARVSVVGAGAKALSDESGRVSFLGLPFGEYLLESTSEAQDLLRLPRELKRLRVTPGRATLDTVSTIPDVVAIGLVCPLNNNQGVVAGIVRLEGRETDWTRIRALRVRRRDDGTESVNEVRSAWSGGGGRFHMCRLPRGERLRIVVRFEDGVEQSREVTIAPIVEGTAVERLTRVDFDRATPVVRTAADQGLVGAPPR